jgi:hypothetical protein
MLSTYRLGWSRLILLLGDGTDSDRSGCYNRQLRFNEVYRMKSLKDAQGRNALSVLEIELFR